MADKSKFQSPGNNSIDKLQLIEGLWQKLIQVKWSPALLELLGRLIRDLVKSVRPYGDEDLLNLASNFENQFNIYEAASRPPQVAERKQFADFIIELRHALESAASDDAPLSAKDRMSVAMTEVLVVGAEDTQKLAERLEDAGLRARCLSNLDEAEATLVLTAPIALIIDTDFPQGPATGVATVARLRAHEELAAPVFFIGERDDLAARLEAVQAGGDAYFVKPVDSLGLLEKLNYRLFDASSIGYHRVLIVDDNLSEARRMSAALEGEGIITKIVTEPLSVLPVLRSFQPDLLVLDLDLSEGISGPQLARVLRQHKDCKGRPVLLLCDAIELDLRLKQLQNEGDDLLLKPVAVDHLCWIVRQHLSRTWAAHAKLAALSRKDAITGLYYRRYFLAQLERTLAAQQRKNGGQDRRSVAVMLIVLDNLRAVREATDVAITDELMGWAAARLKRVLGAGYQSAWFSEDIFAVLIRDASKATLLDTAHSARRSLEGDPYEIDGYSIRLRTRIGVAIAEGGKDDFLGLIRQADLACDLAREAKGEHIHIHDPDADSKLETSYEQNLLAEIREAVEEERLNLVFQPVVGLRGDPVERYEVLLRMRDSEGRELLPGIVFSAVQKHPLSVALDRWIVAQSMKLLLERQNRVPPTTLFVNISLVSLSDELLHAWLRERLQKAPDVARRLVFEVAEATASQHLQELKTFLDCIKPLGCGLSLERFGLRENSLVLAQELPVDYMKLDNSFVQNLARNKTKQRHVKDLVEQLSPTGAIIIATGVEDLQSLPVLWSCGINYVQGFFLQQPHETMSFDFRGGVL